MRHIAEHEPARLRARVDEPGADAHLLEEPRDERVVALAVLRPELDRRVLRLVNPELVLDLPLGEDHLHDPRDRDVLKQAVLSALREAPEGGRDRDRIRSEALPGVGDADEPSRPAEAPKGALDVARYLELGPGADEPRQVDIVVRRHARGARDEELAYALLHLELAHGEADLRRLGEPDPNVLGQGPLGRRSFALARVDRARH